LNHHDHRNGARVKIDNVETWVITTPDTLHRFPHPDPDNPGEIRWSVDAAFNWLVSEVDKIIAERINDDPAGAYLIFEPDSDFAFFCRLLQINYRITPEVVMHLQLMSDQFVNEAMTALVGSRRGTT